MERNAAERGTDILLYSGRQGHSEESFITRKGEAAFARGLLGLLGGTHHSLKCATFGLLRDVEASRLLTLFADSFGLLKFKFTTLLTLRRKI